MALDKVCQLIRNSTSVVKIRATYCLASLIAVEKDSKTKPQPVDQRITLMTREWFRTLKRQAEPAVILFEICKNPFPDIKLAGFALLDAICQHHWGQELVSGVAGFIEYLLDRPEGFTKEEKEAKYNIVKRLANSTVFDPNIVSRCELYVEQGPFYKDPILEVVYENSD